MMNLSLLHLIKVIKPQN